MRILVTGSTGFIGGAFVRQAKAAGHKILSFSRQPQSTDNDLLHGSLENPPWPEIERFNPEACVHCAWITTPGEYLQSAENDRLCAQSLKFALSLKERGVQKFVGIGTCLEYASSLDALDEEAPSPTNPTPYSAAKTRLRQGLEQVFTQPESLAWLRVFYAYGKGENPARLISAFLRVSKMGQNLDLQRPDDVVDYVNVADIASAILAVVQSRAGGIFNVGSGIPLRLRDLAAALEEIGGGCGAFKLGNPSSLESRYANISKLKGLGWVPRISLLEGLAEMTDGK